MGVKALDEIYETINNVLYELRNHRISHDTICFKQESTRNVDTILYVIQKAANDLMFLSKKLAKKGYGDRSFLGRLKQMFQGLLGGF